MAVWLGLPVTVAKAAARFYCGISSRFKYAGHYGTPWKRNNSIAQGCPRSIRWANVFGTIWARMMEQRHPEVPATIFVYDKNMRSRSRAKLCAASRAPRGSTFALDTAKKTR